MQLPTEALRGREVLVTGATGFVGGALARRLAEDEGARVTGCGRSLDKARGLEGAGVHLEAADLLDPARMSQSLTRTASWWQVGGRFVRAVPTAMPADPDAS